MKAKPGFNLRNVCGEMVLVAEGKENIDFSNIISMNETAAYLWKKVQTMDSFSADDLTKFLMAEYEVDEDRAHNDSVQLIEDWLKVGIIEA